MQHVVRLLCVSIIFHPLTTIFGTNSKLILHQIFQSSILCVTSRVLLERVNLNFVRCNDLQSAWTCSKLGFVLVLSNRPNLTQYGKASRWEECCVEVPQRKLKTFFIFHQITKFPTPPQTHNSQAHKRKKKLFNDRIYVLNQQNQVSSSCRLRRSFLPSNSTTTTLIIYSFCWF